jgi:hypothetical protein
VEDVGFPPSSSPSSMSSSSSRETSSSIVVEGVPGEEFFVKERGGRVSFFTADFQHVELFSRRRSPCTTIRDIPLA